MFIIVMPCSIGLEVLSESLLLKLSVLAAGIVLLIVLSGNYASNSFHSVASIQLTLSISNSSVRAPVSGLGHSMHSKQVTTFSSSQPPLVYHDGPVMHNPTAYAIFWLPSGFHFENGTNGNDANYESLMTRFLGDLSGSPYLSITTQYPDNALGSPSDTFHFGGSWIDNITPYVYTGYNLSDFNLPNEIMHAINVNNWPEGTNDIYFLFTAENVLPQLLEAGICAYHSYFTDPNTGEDVVWANIPDIPQPGCELSTPTPNFDQFADSSINLMSHELFESITDPLISAWIDSNGMEIGDKCAWMFGPQVGNSSSEPNADVELNGHYYQVQQEWSNAMNSCTLSGPPTFTDQVTLASYNRPLQPGDYFPIAYVIGGQPFVFHDTGGSVSIATDPFSSVTIGPMSSLSSYGNGKVWCFDPYPCERDTFTSDSNKINLEYYNLVEESVSYSVSDGSVPEKTPYLTYLTASNQTGVNSSSQITDPISTSKLNFWILNGSIASVSASIPGSIGERWAAQVSNYAVASPNSFPTIVYYYQYDVTFNSKIVGGGLGFAPPSITYSSLGSLSAANNSSKVWVDAGTLCNYPQILVGSNSKERWITYDPLSSKIATSEVISLTYLTQYYVTLNVSPTGSASLSTTGGWYNASQSITLSASPSPGWVFQGWSGSGSGSYSGAGSFVTIVVNGPISENALFVQPGIITSSSSSSTSSNAIQNTQSSTTSSSTSLAFTIPPKNANITPYLEIIVILIVVVVAGLGYFFFRRRNIA
jgi:hypothetical protein